MAIVLRMTQIIGGAGGTTELLLWQQHHVDVVRVSPLCIAEEFWARQLANIKLTFAVSVVDKSAGPAVSFVDQQTQQTLTQREFLSLFLPEFDDDDDNPFADDDVQRVPSRVQSTEKRRVFEGSHDIDEARRRWARAVAAAGAFRAAVLKCSANHSGGVYWKGPGMAASTMNDPFVALCCPTVAPLSAVGDGSKFETNQDELKSEKVEYTRVHPVRMVSPDGARVRVPGTHGFVMFKSPSSTLVVPGRTRKHRCRAPVPVVGVWGGLTNADGMAHLASALQARNARLIMDDDGDGELVRDGEAQFLVTDEELATGLRLVALEIRRQIADASVRGEPENHRVFWCTHGHDIPWLHFKVMGTSAVLKKMGKGPLKEQYTVEHLRLLGYDENAVAQRTVQPK